MSRMRLWACSVAGPPSVRWHSGSSSFSWKSKNCSIAQRWTLESIEEQKDSQVYKGTKGQIQSKQTLSADWLCVTVNTQLTCSGRWVFLLHVYYSVFIMTKECKQKVIWPFFGYWRLLKPSDCDWNFLQQVTAAQVFYLLRGCLALCFHGRDLLLHTRAHTHTN